jgi:NAD(P)-dependent dehydrogenase (short-subunit alcohol dehydrogenase family)
LLVGLTRTAALDIKHGIRMNAVKPALIDT